MKNYLSSFNVLFLLTAVAGNASAQSGWGGGLPQVNVLFSDSGVVYAGSSMGSFGSLGSGVYISTDHGSSWTVDSSGIGSANVQAFAALNGDLFAAADSNLRDSTPGGVFRSTNKGASWARVLPDNADALATDGDTLFAAGYHELYHTLDTGAHWDSVPNSIGDKSNLFEFQGSLFVRTSIGSVFRSTTADTEWTYSRITTYGFPAFAAIGNDIFALNASGVWVSSNNGDDWTPELLADTSAFTALLAANNFLVAARDDGGFVFSSDDGSTWSGPQGPVYPSGQSLMSVAVMTFDGTYLILAVIDTDAVEIWRVALSDLGVEANSTEVHTLKIFPNPSFSFLHIQGAGSNVEVLDLMGRVVLSSTISENGMIDVSRLEPGRYEAVVHSSGGIVTAPVIIQH